MTKKAFLLSCSLVTVLLITACGTSPTPIFRITPTVQTIAQEGEVVAIQPSPTAIPPTMTPVPPTAVPTEVPVIPTVEPTIVPTEVVSAGAVEIGGVDYGAGDQYKFFVDSFGVAASGEALFNETRIVQEQEWACTTCHNVEGDAVKIGPSLYGVGERALTRVEGEGPYTYLYNSIHASQDYLVEGFVDGTKMPVYGDSLTDEETYHLIAYLLTLHD
jgi:cytochrome c2